MGWDNKQLEWQQQADWRLDERLAGNAKLFNKHKLNFDCIQSTLALLRTLAITDKIQIPGERGLAGNDSRYYSLSL